MTTRPAHKRRLLTATVGIVATAMLPALSLLPADASTSTASAPSAPGAPVPDDALTIGDSVPGLSALDTRGTVGPTLAQRQAAQALDAGKVRWNQFGTPTSILPTDGVLGSGYSSSPDQAPAAARSWLRDHAAVFGLTTAQIDGLELVNNAELADSDARAVLFRQKFGELTSALDGMVTVGVSDGKIAYVSSSLAKSTGTPPAATLSPLQGWLRAAANIGRGVSPTAVAAIVSSVATPAEGGWTRLQVPGFANQQQARLRALPLADGSVRPVIEANVVDVQGASALAYTLMIDAVTGRVLHRQNQVDNSSDAFQFQGAYTPTACGPQHPFELTDANTKTISASAAALNPVNDIVVKLFSPSGALLISGDTGTSPETVTYSADSIPAGIYKVQVCPFNAPTAPLLPPYDYTVAVGTSDSSTNPPDTSVNPAWRLFTSNPSLSSLGARTPANSTIACWFTVEPQCSYPNGPLANVQAPGPWDTVGGSGQGSSTTVGNNANTREAWASPLTPGGTAQAPFEPGRQYTQRFTDAWNNSKCDPAQLTPGGNDINQSVTNLFASHNFMHDYSYYLGFTERNYNLQTQNLGRGGVEGDPEVGNAQAGALSGGQPSFLGRDNANQIALQDGVPGITNQYLFQPIAGAFYAPCTDGSLDFGIVGHEYTHAISNRMVGGPDQGLTSEQGGAMGESWSDLNAAEYQFNHGYDNGGNIWAVGVYATQNKARAIRDYAINSNPLNFSDYGFDVTGPEVHADGEIWNGTMWSVRQALVDKYDAQYPYADDALQRECAVATETSSPLSASRCPGNRRWIQLIFDSFLLQQGATSMLDARDAMLAADQMRFGGADLDEMWRAFALRGMGASATVRNADDNEPAARYDVPDGRGPTVRVSFSGAGEGKIYIGRHEARVTPIADLDPATARSNVARLTPGNYDIFYVSPTKGGRRYPTQITATPGVQQVSLTTLPNLAAAASGASVIGSTPGSLNPGALLDGTEETNWGGVTATNVDESNPFVSVDLAGGVQTVKRLHVSAMLTPAPGDPTDVPLAVDPDPDSGSRFTAMRKFGIDVCTADCSLPTATWTRAFTSGDDAFPGAVPRPVAPDLILRTFVLPTAVQAAAVRLVALENQCTGFAGYAGEQDNDPLNNTDCKTASDRGTIVHAAELQVYDR